jgi:hypothetical protein
MRSAAKAPWSRRAISKASGGKVAVNVAVVEMGMEK